MTPEVVGAVLAGGRGRRMDGDKLSKKLGGKTLLDHAVDALIEAGLKPTLVLGRDQTPPATASAIRVLRDEIESAGPLGGLHALLRWLPVEWALVMPCDQPFLRPELLRGLLAQARGEVDVVLGQPAEFLEPLPGLYRRTSLRAAEEVLARGERSLHELLSSLRVRTVAAEALRRWDPYLLSYLNVNTPADLARARAVVASASTEPDVS